MGEIKANNALIAWTPRTDQIRVGNLLLQNQADWTIPYESTGGAAYIEVRNMSGLELRHRIMSEFIGIVVRDGVDLMAAHKAFMRIYEYRQAIPPDLEADDSLV